ALEGRLKPLAALAAGTPSRTMAALLTATAGDGGQFLNVYLVDRNGIVRNAALPPQRRQAGVSPLGADLSRTPLFRGLAERTSLWSDKHLSASSGEMVVGIAVRSGEWTAVGEIAPALLHETLTT